MGAFGTSRKRFYRLPLIAVAVLAITAGAGCGGSGGEAGLTKTEFNKQANAICSKSRAERTQAFKKAAPKEQEVEQVIVEESLPPYRQMTKEVEELAPPSGDEEQIEKISLLMNQAAESVEDDLPKATPAINKANEAAQAYGLSDCTF